MSPSDNNFPAWREKLHEVIFEAETPTGKAFDVALLWAIVITVAAVMLESVESIRNVWGAELRALEWCFTALFSIEYLLRLVSVRRPGKYVVSFYGIVDLLALLPTYLSLFIAGTHSLVVIRSLRLLRVFRVLKLIQFVGEANVLTQAIHNSRRKVTIFLGGVLSLAAIMGSLMYIVEGPEHGFTSIPRGVYWAIVTLTTVGYGDIHPQTPLGQALAALVMVLGYGIIAVPTGIVSAELVHASRDAGNTRCCPSCAREGHSLDAVWCKYCGHHL